MYCGWNYGEVYLDFRW